MKSPGKEFLLSTLTKVLVVLLSLFAFALCATITTYVGSASNYKEKYEDVKTEVLSLQESNKGIKTLYNEKTAQMKLNDKELNDIILEKSEDINADQAKIRELERENKDYLTRINNWAGVLSGFEQQIATMTMSQDITGEKLDEARAEMINLQKELNELTTSFYEKTVQMRQVESDKRRLLEKLSHLESSKTANGTARTAASIVTTTRGPARRVAAVPSSVEINGLVKQVGPSHVAISVGTADGVKTGMAFHITRGDNFICDLTVTDVETDEAVGVMELVQHQPIIGDNVSTKL
jgi:hypothetical protein